MTWTQAHDDASDTNLLKSIRDKLAQIGPLARALWVVDTPWAAAEIRTAYRERGFLMELPGPAAGQVIGGPLTVREWRNTPVTTEAEYERCLRLGLWFVRWPGAWVEMSDGRHVRGVITTIEEARKMAEALLGTYQPAPPPIHLDLADLGIPDPFDLRPRWRP